MDEKLYSYYGQPFDEAKAKAEIDRLRAEVARAEDEISTTMTMRLKSENNHLRAENERLREALEQILEWRDHGYLARDIAHAALAPDPPKETEG